MKWQNSTTPLETGLQSKLEITEVENICVQNQSYLIILPGTVILEIIS